MLRALRRIAAPGCLVEIIIGIDEERDKSEIERLDLPQISADYLQNVLLPKYIDAGFAALESGALNSSEWSQLETSWARKLQGGANRQVTYLVLQAGESRDAQ